MEQIRLLEKDITIDLRWSGERLTITPATAQRKTALKAFWTFDTALRAVCAVARRAVALLCAPPMGRALRPSDPG